MIYELWIGTPHEMKKTARGTYGHIRTKARDELAARAGSVAKIDSDAADEFRRAREELSRSGTLKKEEIRAWTVHYLGLTYRIEIRRTA